MTSSRRSCSKSMSISGGSLRSREMKRSKSSDRAALRIDGGDPQTVADAGVGRGAPALAQNFLAAREGDDIVHGQKVRLVAQLGDEGELVLDGRPRSRAGTPSRPAPARAGLRELAQMAGRRLTGRHQLMRILVAQLLERESACAAQSPPSPPAARADRASRAARARADSARHWDRAASRLPDRHAVADRGDRILQSAARAHVHVNIAARHQR